MVSDSQSTCGAQRRRVKFFWRVVVVLACAVVGFFVFSFYALSSLMMVLAVDGWAASFGEACVD